MTDDDVKRTQIRLPMALYRELVDAAGRSGRSMNAEMVIRLEDSLRGPRLPSVQDRPDHSGYISAPEEVAALQLAGISFSIKVALRDLDRVRKKYAEITGVHTLGTDNFDDDGKLIP